MLFDLLERHAADRPDHTAIIRGETGLTWGQWRTKAARLASGLSARGIGPDDTVALLMPNSTFFAVALLALSRIGAQVLPLPTDLSTTEVRNALDAVGCRTVFAADLVSVNTDTAMRVFQVAREDFGEPALARLASDSVDGPCAMGASDAAFCQLLTSGTTGGPRRVVRTQAALYALASAYCETAGLTAADRTLCVTPLRHGHGLCTGLLAPLFSGSTLVLEPTFERRTTLRLLNAERISTFSAPPYIFSILAESVSGEPWACPSLRLGVSAGAPLLRDTWHNVRARLGIQLRQCYGASETGMLTMNTDVDPEPGMESVGRPIAGVELRTGPDGDIAVKSRGAATWWAALEPGQSLTELADSSGWIQLSDTGRLDPAGRLHLTGRKSRFLNIAGRKVNPSEVEAVLESHPRVTKASLVAMTDKHGSEAAKAVVYSSAPLTPEDVAAFCHDRLAPYKRPRLIEIRHDADRSK